MELNRRGFLGSMLAAAAAPAIVRSGILMPVKQIITELPVYPASALFVPHEPPEVLDISSYGADQSFVTYSRIGESHVVKRRMEQNIDIRFAGTVRRDLVDAFHNCEPVNLRMNGFQGTFMVTSIRGGLGNMITTDVGMVSVDRMPGVRVHELDLSHVMRGRTA